MCEVDRRLPNIWQVECSEVEEGSGGCTEQMFNRVGGCDLCEGMERVGQEGGSPQLVVMRMSDWYSIMCVY